MNKHYLITGVLCLVSAGAGAAATYFVVQNRLGAQFDEQLRQEIETTKNYYQMLHKKGEFETPEAAAEKLLPPNKVADLLNGGGEFSEDPYAAAAAKVLTQYGGHALNERTIVTVDKVENVFIKAEKEARGETDEEWAREEQGRTEEAPYVLSKAEFMENETDYTQVTFEYYQGDGVLADEEDRRIEDTESVVGDYNLVRFGHWSGDPRVVYIRNDVRQIEIEITLNDGKYSELVQGFTE